MEVIPAPQMGLPLLVLTLWRAPAKLDTAKPSEGTSAPLRLRPAGAPSETPHCLPTRRKRRAARLDWSGLRLSRFIAPVGFARA